MLRAVAWDQGGDDAIRGEAERKGITSVQDVFVTSGVSETVDICLSALLNPGDNR
jgi:alanine-synthesizing transaminase